MEHQSEILSPEEKTLRSKFINHPPIILFFLAAASLFVAFSLLAALFSPAYMPANYEEGYSLFNQLIPYIALVALVGGGLIAYLAGTIQRLITYAALSPLEFRKAFLPRLTAAEGWSLKGQSEHNILYLHGKAQVLLTFEAVGLVVKCPLRIFLKMNKLALQVRDPGTKDGLSTLTPQS